MVDSTTIILAATVVQTSVIKLTLLVFIFQFRSQENAIKESSVQSLMGRYNGFIISLVEKPELARILFDRIPDRPAGDVTKEQASIYGHMLLASGYWRRHISFTRRSGLTRTPGGNGLPLPARWPTTRNSGMSTM